MTELLAQCLEHLTDLKDALRLTVFLLVVACAVIWGIYEFFRPVDKRLSPGGKPWKLPPGPRGLPIIGNLRYLAKGKFAARDLAKYGEMATVHCGSKLWVTLNTSRVANIIYNRKGLITNGRPPYPVVGDLISVGKRTILQPTEEWSDKRRVMHQLLTGTAVAKYEEYQELESVQLLAEYLFRPDEWYRHHSRYANSVIHRITLGERVGSRHESYEGVFNAQKAFTSNIPPHNIIDCFPELAKLPRFLHWWHRKYAAIGKFTFDAYSQYWAPVITAIKSGTAPRSFAQDILVGKEAKFTGSETDGMFLALQLIEAGADTTRMSLNIFTLAALCNPEAFQKARAEVDKVCGANAERLPMLADEKDMPYICALSKELLRWKPIFTWTPEHMLTEDVELEGYHFPKGTNFVLNHIALCEECEQPEVFRPERWLDGHESNILHGVWQFGGGRRVCVGYRLAQKSLFINIARLVYCYDYEATGPVDTSNIGIHTLGEPFPARANPRSKAHRELVVQSAEKFGVLQYAKET
ncbi:uncharacterized protein A1O5_09229 [Cladophialophora psammophila CBS 110553]|uniref:Cytochrome P450 oxidoreductase n=1 Tax=Cladophialophora psammophila CBS 110553 TaxID=1182543 RepID=W9WIE5_9EURO|nr:uncharacterized protein A1O5_09229 [Cladophialophora psammophila CBS 110553]EXJ67882.1 hypothetical protein A1O5_09229 [Cladophialophora psammophila CBS 110553]